MTLSHLSKFILFDKVPLSEKALHSMNQGSLMENKPHLSSHDPLGLWNTPKWARIFS